MSYNSPAAAPVPPDAVVPPRHVGQAIRIFLISILLGPPIGGWLFLGGVLLFGKKPSDGLTLEDVGGVVMLGGVMGYVMGITRASAAGGWVAYKVWRDGTVGYLETAAAAAVVSLIGVAYLAITSVPTGATVTLGLILGAVSVTAALTCRWIAALTGILPR